MIYFIGGAPLSGKSEVVTAFLEHIKGRYDVALQYVGTDSIRRILWENNLDEQEPKLVQLHRDRRRETEEEWIERTTTNPDYAVQRQHNQSEVVWRRAIKPLLACNSDRNLPTLIEGIAVRPPFIADYPEPHAAVFIGNNATTLDEEHLANVIASVRNKRNHWMRTWSEAKIRTYVTYQVPAYSNRLRELSSAHGYRYYDLSQGEDYRIIQQKAASYLASKAAWRE